MKKDIFFLHEFDDTRKIFSINLILMKIQFNENIELITLFFDIFIISLNEKTIIHSQFKISIIIYSNFIYNIFIQSYLIELIYEM